MLYYPSLCGILCDGGFVRTVEVNIRPELCVFVIVQSKRTPVVGAGGGRGRVFVRDRRERGYIGGVGVLYPWLGEEGVLLLASSQGLFFSEHAAMIRWDPLGRC